MQATAGASDASSDYICPPLVDPWLGEVVGTSLALGKAMWQPLLALGAIWEVIRCSDGAPSAHRVSSRSLTCIPFFSKLNTRTPLFFIALATIHQRLCAWCMVNGSALGVSYQPHDCPPIAASASHMRLATRGERACVREMRPSDH